MFGENKQGNTENTNSEIRQTHFLVQNKYETSDINSKIIVAFNGNLGA